MLHALFCMIEWLKPMFCIPFAPRCHASDLKLLRRPTTTISPHFRQLLLLLSNCFRSTLRQRETPHSPDPSCHLLDSVILALAAINAIQIPNVKLYYP
ncbi:hypothetical protein DM02DRAFT_609381 [Periconia macrospinosa]|uniref:Uncharacterized protein n=1 Tax=Periconia macrospinosa TaxID=97972 RepID=A0A2V1E8T4_9PLEO|nr:hypothetical protein DM02DRAFT_609381 [Periconia macrospinosa]